MTCHPPDRAVPFGSALRATALSLLLALLVAPVVTAGDGGGPSSKAPHGTPDRRQLLRSPGVLGEDVSPPRSPGNLAVSAVSGEQVDTFWMPATDDRGVVAYRIYRDGVAVGRVQGTRFRDEGLEPGKSYRYTVTAVDAAGNESPVPSPVTALTPGAAGDTVLDVWYGDTQKFGNIGHAQRWVNILGAVSDPDGIASLSFSLNGGADRVLSIGPDGRRLYFPGDFVIEVDFDELNLGLNTFRIRAVDGGGDATERSVTVDYGGPTVWPEVYSVDWSSVTDLQDVVQIVDGKWSVSGDSLRPDRPGYDRLIAIGDRLWDDYELIVPFTLHSIDPAGFLPPSFMPGFGLLMRWTGHTDEPAVCPQPHCGWQPHGGSAWYWWDEVGGMPGNIGGSIVDPADRGIDFNTPYILKMRVETGPAGYLYRYRIWPAAEMEPTVWTATGLGHEDVAAGSTLIIAHHVDVTIGDLQARALPDVQDPVAPASLTATPTSAFGMRLSWPAGTDDFQIVEYRIERDGLPIASTTALRFDDRVLLPDTLYNYEIVAVDEAGNESAPVAASARTLPRPPGPVCGDGIVSLGEQCDDGGVVAGDGCSIACTLEATSENVVDNGDFAAGKQGWSFYSNGNARLLIQGGASVIEITTQGTNVQLYRRDIALEGDTLYRLTFLGKNSSGGDVAVSVRKHTSPYSSYGVIRRRVDLGTEWALHTVEFTTTSGDKTDGRLMFELSQYDQNGDEYGFDDIVLEKVVSSCGDGVEDAVEACDDGNLDNTDACLNDCNLAACGDLWIHDGTETCDDGNTDAGDGCSSSCLPESGCGDGILDDGEECDDANQDTTDDCVDCVDAGCGDGFVHSGFEECDDGNAVAGDGCSSICEIEPFCGDGNLDAGEACDDGNADSTDDCLADCTLPACGDGFVQTGVEACDDGGLVAGDGCSAICSLERRCGDGLQQPGEQCDDGNLDDDDGCSATCRQEISAPNAVVNPSFDDGKSSWRFYSNGNADWSTPAGEALIDITTQGTNVQLYQRSIVLEPGTRYRLRFHAASSDGRDLEVSLQRHTAPFPNYGIRKQRFDLDLTLREHSFEFTTPLESINDARLMFWLAPYDANGTQYRIDDVVVEPAVAICGDGVVEGAEACDDGNLDNTDACLNDCSAARCGDTWLQGGVEACDDGNTADGDGCSASCEEESACGDGVTDPGEECDDGNGDPLDGCTNDCLARNCGDGLLDSGEACDDGNLISGDGCRDDCTVEICGDMRFDPGEDCDDGNNVGGDGCRADCTVESCGDGILDPGEQCDDGNFVLGDGCRPTCLVEGCGDGFVESGESCDPPGPQPGGLGECRDNCSFCGDGVRQVVEACDDGNNVGGDGCRADCTVELCGDGVQDPQESCDDGNTSNFDGCNSVCGNEGCALFSDDMESGAPGWSSAVFPDPAKIATPPGPSTWHLGATTCRGDALDSTWYLANGNDGPGCEENSSRERSRLMSPPIALPAATSSKLVFDALSFDEGGACLEGLPFDRHDVGVTLDDGATYVLLNDCTALADGAGTRVHHEFDLVAWAGQTIRILFVYETADANHGHTFAIDDVAVTGDSCAAVENVLDNGDFGEGQASWRFYTSGNGAFSITSEGEARIAMTTRGTNTQLYQRGVELAGNTRYRLSFTGRSSDGRDLDVSVRRHTAPYTDFGLNNALFDLTTESQSFSVEFTTTSGDKTDARVMFWLGPYNRDGSIYHLDDVLLERLDP